MLLKLVELRKRAGLTQRELGRRLGREHSFVWRIETGERRLDVIEFYWVCQALGQDAATVYGQLVGDLAAPAAAPLPKAAEPGVVYIVPRRGKKAP